MKGKSESEVAQSCPTLQPHGLQPTRLLHPWHFPGKSTGVGVPLPSLWACEASCKQPSSTGSMRGHGPSQEDDSWAPQGWKEGGR